MAVLFIALVTWLGTMFVYSAGLKLVRYDRAGQLVKPYAILPVAILPVRVASAVGFLLPWAELAAGMLLLLGLLFPAGPLLAATLGASFAYGAFRVLRRGADVHCGCTGAEERVNRTTLTRALLITASSFLLLGSDWHEPAALPGPVAVSLAVVSLLPAGLSAFHRIRDALRHRQRVRRQQHELVRLRGTLAAPPAAPALNGFVLGAASAAVAGQEGSTVHRRPAL